MYLTITSIKLTGPFKFFWLAAWALQITRQLKSNDRCVKYKSTGMWTLHYTMSLWKTEQDLKDFARSGAHMDAMKKQRMIAKEIRTLTMPGDQLPKWADAKRLLKEKGRVLSN